MRVDYSQDFFFFFSFLANLAETAVRYLEQTQFNSPTEMPAHRYEFELSALHEMLTLTVSNLLTDSQAIVKQTLIESGITKLCVFFGRQKGCALRIETLRANLTNFLFLSVFFFWCI